MDDAAQPFVVQHAAHHRQEVGGVQPAHPLPAAAHPAAQPPAHQPAQPVKRADVAVQHDRGAHHHQPPGDLGRVGGGLLPRAGDPGHLRWALGGRGGLVQHPLPAVAVDRGGGGDPPHQRATATGDHDPHDALTPITASHTSIGAPAMISRSSFGPILERVSAPPEGVEASDRERGLAPPRRALVAERNRGSLRRRHDGQTTPCSRAPATSPWSGPPWPRPTPPARREVGPELAGTNSAPGTVGPNLARRWGHESLSKPPARSTAAAGRGSASPAASAHCAIAAPPAPPAGWSPSTPTSSSWPPPAPANTIRPGGPTTARPAPGWNENSPICYADATAAAVPACAGWSA